MIRFGHGVISIKSSCDKNGGGTVTLRRRESSGTGRNLFFARTDRCKTGIDVDVRTLKSRFLTVQVKIDIDMRAKDQTVRRTAEVEHARFLS